MRADQQYEGIDVVIATYNRSGAVDNVINDLFKQCLPDDKFYIVFQGSSQIKKYDDPRIKSLYSSPPNLPKARNAGMKAGVNPIILFVDDDVVPDENLLSNHRSCYNDRSIAAVAGYVDDPLFEKENDCPSVFDPSTGKLTQNFSVRKSQFTVSVMGANMSFRREALNRIGGFDPCFRRNALWEEIDCAFRLLKNNFKIWYCADARVTHLRNSTGGCREDRNCRYIFHSYANTAYFCCKYMPAEYLKSWFTYWKYHLEYESRIKSGRKNRIIKHDLFCVAAAVCGVLSGICRYHLYGKRIGLPLQFHSDNRDTK
jgi:GT2 family glycosyltransferase